MCNLDIWTWVTRIGENLACKLFFGSSLDLITTPSGYVLSSPSSWPRAAFLDWSGYEAVRVGLRLSVPISTPGVQFCIEVSRIRFRVIDC